MTDRSNLDKSSIFNRQYSIDQERLPARLARPPQSAFCLKAGLINSDGGQAAAPLLC
jgi:hypothetical protein